MRRAAWVYVGGVLGLSAVLSIATYFQNPGGSSSIAQFATLTIIASLLRIFVIEAPRHRSYEGSTIILFASVLILSPWQFILVVVIAHGVEWIKERWIDSKLLRAWYIQPFNMSKHILSGLSASTMLDIGNLRLSTDAVLIAVVGSLVYVLVNQSLLGIALYLARGIPFHKAGIIRDGLLIELPLAITGFIVVVLLRFAPDSVLFILAPALLIYQGFRLPKVQDEYMESLEVVNQELTAANQSIRQLNDELFLTLAKIFDARDPYVGSHAAQVAAYAVAIAHELKLPAEHINLIRQSGYLHDIGKIAISDSVLHKPCKLSESEYQYIKRHADIGADFIATSQGLRHLSPFIRHHHERWDGGGYPMGLKGEEIPLEARILNVCDSVEAMASDRPYHRAMSIDAIITELQRCSGTQFDPQVVEAFVNIAERDGASFITNSARTVSLHHTGDGYLVNDLNASMFAPLYRVNINNGAVS